jgi:glutathione reductase (NADPH)
MWEASNFYDDMRYAYSFGVDVGSYEFRWEELKRRRDRHVAKVNGRYAEGLQNAGIDIIEGWATFRDNRTIQVGDQTYTSDHILIATGSESAMPDIPGVEHAICSDGFFQLDSLPKTSIVLGNGYIAAEMTGLLNSFGSAVTACIRTQQYCGRMFDCEVANYVAEVMSAHGVDMRYGHLASEILQTTNGAKTVKFTNGSELTADEVLIAIGRSPKLSGLGLENTDVTVNEGFVQIDEF